MSNNFQFLSNENQELYAKCSYAEQFAKTFPNNSLVETRKALEFFLQRECTLRNITFTPEENPYRSSFPPIHTMIKKTADQLNLFTPVQRRTMHDIKNLGNDSAHVSYKGEVDEVELTGPVSTKQAIDIIRKLHELLRQYYGKKYSDIPEFDQRLIPINDMHPEAILPVERDEACGLKLRCKSINDETGISLYYIVRQYRREQVDRDKTFVLRDMFTLEKLSQGGSSAQHLVKYSRVNVQKQNDLLFTCFEISQDAVSLDRYKLEPLSTRDRLALLIGIANGIEEMHTNGSPIVHRYLRPSSILIGAGRKPLICNFEYAKLENPQQATVRYKLEARSDPYTPPELARGGDFTLWPSVDIYSLAVLILYVFGLPVGGEEDPDRLKKHGLSNGFIEMVHDMLSDVAAERPDIREVKARLQQEEDQHV